MSAPNARQSECKQDNSVLGAILKNLPSSEAFSAFEPSIRAGSFKRYISTPSDTSRQTRITNEKNRCLIRALTARPYRNRKRTAPSVTQPAAKRTRWIQMDKEKKQMCLKVALTAACRHSEVGDVLDRLRQGWAQNPRRKQSVNAEIRRTIRERVPLWTEIELRQYLLKAGDYSDEMNAEEMRRAISEHLSELS